MQRGKLLIAVPTKDHPDHMRYYLSEVLPDAKKYQVDICVFDSSHGNATKEIADARIRQGYTNLSYKRCRETMGFGEKLEEIFSTEGYDYIWLCGDGFVLSLDECASLVREEMDQNRDLIVFTDRKAAPYRREIADAASLMKYCWDEVTCWAPWIVRRKALDLKNFLGGGGRRKIQTFSALQHDF